MRRLTALPCPFCGSAPKYVKGPPHDGLSLIGCVEVDCPIEGLVVSPEQWNERPSPRPGPLPSVDAPAADAVDEVTDEAEYRKRPTPSPTTSEEGQDA